MQIDMKQLRSMNIARDGKSAWFQGGAYAYEVIPFLWDRGYVTSEHTSQFISLPCEANHSATQVLARINASASRALLWVEATVDTRAFTA